MKICKDKKYAVENNVNFEFSLLMTLDMKKMRLSEFIYYSRTNRVFDIKFTNSDKWQHWKRIPPMKCPMLYERVNSYNWFLLYFIHSWIYYILCEILYFISSSILFYHWDLEKQGERWVVALERNECNVSQLSDCYQNGAFTQTFATGLRVPFVDISLHASFYSASHFSTEIRAREFAWAIKAPHSPVSVNVPGSVARLVHPSASGTPWVVFNTLDDPWS